MKPPPGVTTEQAARACRALVGSPPSREALYRIEVKTWAKRIFQAGLGSERAQGLLKEAPRFSMEMAWDISIELTNLINEMFEEFHNREKEHGEN